MDHLAPIEAQLRQSERALEEELAKVRQMLSVFGGSTFAPAPTPRQRHKKEEQTPAATDQQPNPESRWGGGKTNSNGGETQKKKKKYGASKEIVEDLYKLIVARKSGGTSFTDQVPGSISMKELSTASGRNVGTVRKAVAQLEKEGKISSKLLSWKELGLTAPAGQTRVLVATEEARDAHS